MNEDQELKNFIKKMSPEASLPTLAFESRLKKKLLTKNKGPLLKRLQMSMREFWFGMGGVPYSNFGVLTAGVLFLSVSLAGLYLYSINNQLTIFQPENQLTAQENYTLLTNIYKNNPQALLSASAQNSLLTEMIEASPLSTQTKLSEALSMQPASVAQITTPKSFNFFHITYTKELGPLAEACPELATDNSTIETYTYETSGLENSSFTKVVRYSAEGGLLSLSMTDNVSTYDYLGGAYVARTPISNFPIEVPTTPVPSLTPEESEKIKNLYGSETLIKKVTENNKEYYQVIQTDQTEALQNCPTLSKNITSKFVIVQTIDPKDNYRIISTAYYLDEINPARLLVKTNNEYESANLTTEAALAKFFQLTPEVPAEIEIRDFSATDSTVTLDELVETLNDKEISLILPDTAEKRLVNYSDNINNVATTLLKSDYLNDKAFYSSENWTAWQTQLKQLTDATDELISYELATKNGSRILVDIIKPTALSYGCDRGIAKPISIDREEIAATAFESDSYYLCFNFAGYNYQVKIMPQAGEIPGEMTDFRLVTKQEASSLLNDFLLTQLEVESDSQSENN